MGQFSEENLYGMTIRESATDGSDFTNPDADYRRLFLGEDGQLHVKDSAGAVTDIGASAGSVATDAIWDAAGDLAVGSGANTAAKLTKGAAGANLSTYNGVVGWNGGTSFPGSPVTGDRYWRSDLGMEFFYNGTLWLTTFRVSMTMTLNPAIADPLITGYSATQSACCKLRWPALGAVDLDFYWEYVEGLFYVATTNDGSKYWTLGDGTTVMSTVGLSADTNLLLYATPNRTISNPAYMQFNFTKVSTPGQGSFSTPTITGRWIGT